MGVPTPIVEAKILDLSGHVIFTTKTIESSQIDVASLVPGVYLGKVLTENQEIYVDKFIKQ